MDTGKAQYAALGAADAIGRDVAPKRYSVGGRETFDRQRDVSRALTREFAKRTHLHRDSAGVEDLGDFVFGVHLQLTALKYSDREGKKPGTDDSSKHDVYMDMARHILDGAPDPRAGRAEYTPYVEVPFVE
jgi:hypothetical protein